jgi:amidase
MTAALPGTKAAPDRLVYIPTAAELGYTFGGRAPVATVRPGQVLEVYTEDCFRGLVRTQAELPSQVCPLPYVNPVSGPFAIEGAEPGDTLAVHIVSVAPARDWAVSATFPHFGALTSSPGTPTLQPPLEERVWVYEIDAEACIARYRATRSEHTVELPLAPMIGTIGVAPEGGQVILSEIPGPHGGNLDTPEMAAGATLYLGVNVPAALFALGDGHLRQGDGEVCGVGIEAATTTVLIIDLIKGGAPVWPRLETDTHLMCIGGARPLEDAYRIAHADLTQWIHESTGMDLLDSYQLLSQAGTARIGNVCDAIYTVVAQIEKRFLPVSAATDPGGVHDRLAAAAQALRAG